MQIQQALRAACSALGLDRLDAQLLLLHAMGRPQNDRAWLITHDDDTLDEATEMRYINLSRRRAAGTPLAYITGMREFYGLALQVDARVLDPRPDTEILVDWALELLPHGGQAIDLGTGSGAIALALKSSRPDAQVDAVDASDEALAVAMHNAERLDLAISLRCGYWLDNQPRTYDLIVSNPPYIADDDPHLQDLGHEPRMALTSGADGLDAIRHIVRHAGAHLQSGGWLLLEHGWTQAQAVRELLEAGGFAAITSRRDLAGIERCSGGQWPGAGRTAQTGPG